MQTRRDGGRGRGPESAAFSISDEHGAARLKHRVRSLLTAWQLRGLADAAAELVGVLVAAATPHPRRRAEVHLQWRDGVLRGEVSGSHLFPPQPTHDQRPDDQPAADPPSGAAVVTGEVGSGVYERLPALLAARSTRWGSESSATGCTVWFELNAPTRWCAPPALEPATRATTPVTGGAYERRRAAATPIVPGQRRGSVL